MGVSPYYDRQEAEAPKKSRYQEILDEIQENQIEARRTIADHLMRDPGFLSTFGDNFAVEYGTIEFFNENSRAINPLNEVRIRISQEIRFYRDTSNDR